MMDFYSWIGLTLSSHVSLVEHQKMKFMELKQDIEFVTSWHANRLRFGILLALQVPSFFCYLWVFYLYFYRRRFHRRLDFHVIMILLVISFLFLTIAFSLTQIYFFFSYVISTNEIFCSFWNWFHYSLNIINLFLMAFLSIERHVLIFHPQYLQTNRQKFFFHVIPILFCLLYPPLFYVGAIFLCPCENTYDYSQLLCTWPCYFGHPIWAKIDLFVSNYTPLLTIPLFCSSLYLRVFFQRRSMRQQVIKWRRDRKLIVQLWLISSLYLAMWMPLQICGIINLYFDPSFLLQAQIDYMYLLPYIIHLVYPFIVLAIIHPDRCRRRIFSGTIRPLA